MNAENKIPLSAMQNRLQAIEHYDNPEQAFETLLYGWNRQRKATASALHQLKKQGFMTPYMAHQFAAYCGYPIDRET